MDDYLDQKYAGKLVSSQEKTSPELFFSFYLHPGALMFHTEKNVIQILHMFDWFSETTRLQTEFGENVAVVSDVNPGADSFVIRDNYDWIREGFRLEGVLALQIFVSNPNLKGLFFSFSLLLFAITKK